MLIAPHVAVGAAIGLEINNPYLVVILAIISHFVLDMIPHYDSGTIHYNEKKLVLDWRDWLLITFDIILAGVIFWFFYRGSDFSFNVFLGAAVSFGVDLIDKVFQIEIKNKKIAFANDRKIPVISAMNKFHEKANYNLNPKYWYWGVLTQIIVTGGSIICLIK